jgi:hypothetical protein
MRCIFPTLSCPSLSISPTAGSLCLKEKDGVVFLEKKDGVVVVGSMHQG